MEPTLIFSNVSYFYVRDCSLPSPQVKLSYIIITSNLMYQLSHDLLNTLSLKFFGSFKKVSKLSEAYSLVPNLPFKNKDLAKAEEN